MQRLTEQDEKRSEQMQRLTEQDEKRSEQTQRLTEQDEKRSEQIRRLTDQNEKRSEQIRRLTDQNEQLSKQTKKLEEDNRALIDENRKFCEQVKNLSNEPTAVQYQQPTVDKHDGVDNQKLLPTSTTIASPLSAASSTHVRVDKTEIRKLVEEIVDEQRRGRASSSISDSAVLPPLTTDQPPSNTEMLQRLHEMMRVNDDTTCNLRDQLKVWNLETEALTERVRGCEKATSTMNWQLTKHDAQFKARDLEVLGMRPIQDLIYELSMLLSYPHNEERFLDLVMILFRQTTEAGRGTRITMNGAVYTVLGGDDRRVSYRCDAAPNSIRKNTFTVRNYWAWVRVDTGPAKGLGWPLWDTRETENGLPKNAVHSQGSWTIEHD